MKAYELLEMIGETDEKIIEEAEKSRRRTRAVWIRWTAAAACLLLIVSGIFWMADDNGSSRPDRYHHSSEETAGSEGVYIPPMMISDGVLKENETSADMIAAVVYRDQVYTQAESYYGEDAQKVNGIVGRYLGHADGNINEWSDRNEYSREFASTVEGDVYAVKGYDEDFRICIRHEYENDKGEKEIWICFLERLNDITLKNGSDLFGSRLHLESGVKEVRYKTHDEWNSGSGNTRKAEITEDVWKKFLQEIEAARFGCVWKEDMTEETVYDAENQAHIALAMKDGTTVSLRLIEGGYVGYEPLGWYFVKLPGETFDRVFEACGGMTRK